MPTRTTPTSSGPGGTGILPVNGATPKIDRRDAGPTRSFDPNELLITSTAVDDDWPLTQRAPHGGAHRSAMPGFARTAESRVQGAGMTTVHQFNDFKVGFDDDSDDTLDADEVVLHDDFNSATITLTHDDNGNLTYDGVYEYVYDFLNRLVKVKYAEPSGGADLTVAEYEYDGMNRRIRKHVQNFGEGVVPGSDEGGTITGIQAGNRHEHYYYAGWRVIEERNNSDDVLAQMVWSVEYIDAPVCRDRNTDVDSDNDCLDSAGSERYFYHQGPNYRVWALTDESGDVVERYDYDAYGEPRIYAGHDSGVSAELGNALFVSSVGNPYMHQGLRRDDESGLHENRMRAYHSQLGRFTQRDPTGYVDSMNLYEYLDSMPVAQVDPSASIAVKPGTPPPPPPRPKPKRRWGFWPNDCNKAHQRWHDVTMAKCYAKANIRGTTCCLACMYPTTNHFAVCCADKDDAATCRKEADAKQNDCYKKCMGIAKDWGKPSKPKTPKPKTPKPKKPSGPQGPKGTKPKDSDGPCLPPLPKLPE